MELPSAGRSAFVLPAAAALSPPATRYFARRRRRRRCACVVTVCLVLVVYVCIRVASACDAMCVAQGSAAAFRLVGIEWRCCSRS